MSRQGFHGIYPMLYAFFDQRGALDRNAMSRQVEGCIAGGVHGLAVGGLASECGKLSPAEKRDLCKWVLEDTDGRVPVSLTITEPSSEAQSEMARFAADEGAAWVVLQPPPVKEISEQELISFFGSVADASPVPVGIQNAPQFIGVGLSDDGLIALNKRHPNVSILKAEGDAMASAALAAASEGAFDLFNGRNGVDLIDTLAAGFAGVIPSPDASDMQARIYDLVRAGDQHAAQEAFKQIAPLLGFLMLSIDHLLCYGKRLTARRLGLGEVHDRAPAEAPNGFGLESLERWSRDLGPLGA
ncbi:MAG: dihydrodipicolinate synthase family protein [Pseudomonadota bacterium]